MKEIFLKLIEEASIGKVMLDNEEWPIGFSTILNEKQYCFNETFPVLNVENQEQFFELLEKYIELELKQNRKSIPFITNKEENRIKLLMAYLFVNATTTDFMNPISLLRKRISFLEDKTYLNFTQKIPVHVEEIECFLEINNKEQSILMETPNKMEFSFTKENVKYELPSIFYGIDNNVCYIYSILNNKKKPFNTLEEEQFYKKINRKLYKLNNNIEEDTTLLENITDVSMSSIISLNIFLTMLKKQKIENIKFVPYLPLRYQSREIVSQINPSKEKELQERNDYIQRNITDKFIRTVRRVLYHRNDFEIISYPYEIDDLLHIKNTKDYEKINNDLLEEVNKTVK